MTNIINLPRADFDKLVESGNAVKRNDDVATMTWMQPRTDGDPIEHMTVFMAE